MDILFLVGRIILGGYFVMGGFNHFKNLNMMTGYAKSKGTPAPALAVGGSGVMLILGGLSILAGLYPFVGIVLLAVFLVGVTPVMHNFWTVKDPQARMVEMINFSKNLALLGALLMLLEISQPWPMSFTIK
jgi:putative oxidoreductase